MALPTPSQPAISRGDAADFASLIAPSAETSDGSQSLALPVNPNFKFFLHHWPGEWSVADVEVEVAVGDPEKGKTKKVKKAFWLPTLAKHVVRPGINMNRTLKVGEKPRAAYDGQVLLNMRQGSAYLDLGDFRTRLPDGRLYRSQAPARHPRTGREGLFYLETVKTPRDKVGNKRLKFDIDRPLYNQWRRDLVRLGCIRPPAPSTIREKVAFLQSEIGRCSAMTTLDPAERKRRIAAATAEWKRWDEATVPELDPVFLAERQAAA